MKKQGFTLIEILIAVILIGMAIASLLASNVSFTKANAIGTNLCNAEFLIEQIRELTAILPATDPDYATNTFGTGEASLAEYDDVDDFDAQTFNPPIDTLRQPISDLSAFTQVVTVENVSMSNLEQTAADNSTDFLRITVDIKLNNNTISSASWIRARY